MAPPTLDLEAPDPAGDGIDFVANEARPLAMEYAPGNGFGFGFGGVNASVLFRRWTDAPAAAGWHHARARTLTSRQRRFSICNLRIKKKVTS